jgi:Sulfatase
VRLRTAALHLLVLWAFAVAQPLFDLLGKNGEFFAARGSTRWDVVLFAFVLMFVPPAILAGLEALIPQPARTTVHGVLVAALFGLFVLQAIRSDGGAGWLLVAVAAAIGLGAALAYLRWPGARLILTVLAPAPLLFLGLFLLHSDASRLTFSGGDTALAAGKHARAPVILVAFDELPINSLRDSHGRIDRVRFPNFAALAAGSTWFANTSTVGEGTTHAIPAILTGRFPRAGEFPVYTDHRQNLFTLLGGTADLHVVDQETHLCPPKLCPGIEGSFGGRMHGLAEDTGIVYLRQLLPDSLTGGIPSIANGWDNFLRNASRHEDPGAIPPAFLRSLEPGPRPALWYVHFMLPHSPWRFLPSGRRYSIRQAPGWGGDEVWNANQAAVDQYWQRHLLQLGYADRVLGRLIAHLRETGLYDKALLVVTADHGISFRAGEKRRPLSDANLQDIAYVPLFVKLPQQQGGRVDRAPARTIDIVPTIADATGVRIPWSVDGHSLLGAQLPERSVVLVKDAGKRFVVPATELEARRERALQRQLTLFGSGEPVSSLYAVGPGRETLNHSIEGRPLDARLDPIDRSSDPVQVSGAVPEATRAVAVVVGGKVVAVAPAAKGRFWALVPRARLRAAKPLIYAIKARS